MGKVRRLRQKYHTSLAKDRKEKGRDGSNLSPDIPQLVPVVKRKLDDGVNTSDNMFASFHIKLGKATGSKDKSDRMSVVSSGQQNKNGTKKGRRIQRRDKLMKKIDVIRTAERKEKERKKREKTVIVGDMHPILNALPSLEELAAVRSRKEIQASKKDKRNKKQNEKQKDFLSNVWMFMKAHQDPFYKKDPFEAVAQAVENRVLSEDS